MNFRTRLFTIVISLVSVLEAQNTFTEAEALEMITQRDAQWQGKIAKADSLIESQKVVINDCEKLVKNLEEQAKLDTLVLLAQRKQIDLLKQRVKVIILSLIFCLGLKLISNN